MAITIDPEKLQDMKYAELQKMAKSVGIKANMKCEKLRQCLADYAALHLTDDEDSAEETPAQSDSLGEFISEDDEVVIQPKASSKSKKKGRKGRAKNAAPQVVSAVPETPTPEKLPAAKTPPMLKTNTRFFPTPKASPLAVSPSPQLHNQGVRGGARPKLTPKKATPVAKTPVKASSASKGRATPLSNKKATPLSLKTATPLSNKKATPQSNKKTTPAAKQATRSSVTPSGTPHSGKKNSAKKADTPSSGNKRRSRKSASPAVREMLASMKEGMSDAELKDSLLSTLEKSVSDKMEAERTEPSSQIPRFAAFALQKKAQGAQKTTPGSARWERVHAKTFSKMDSIDLYLEKKRKRTESIQTSVKKARLIAEKTRSAIDSLKKCRTPPVSANKVRATGASRAALFKSPHMGVPFVPKVTSVSKIHTNFSTLKSPGSVPRPLPSSVCKENKPSVANRKSLAADRKSIAANEKSARKSVGAPRKSIGANKTFTMESDNLNKSSMVTPFKFTANTTLPASNPRPKFDLAASLSKPMTWKTHKGKLPSFSVKRQDPKEVKVTSREDRRVKSKAHQSNHRLAAQMKRRGMV